MPLYTALLTEQGIEQEVGSLLYTLDDARVRLISHQPDLHASAHSAAGRAGHYRQSTGVRSAVPVKWWAGALLLHACMHGCALLSTFAQDHVTVDSWAESRAI